MREILHGNHFSYGKGRTYGMGCTYGTGHTDKGNAICPLLKMTEA